MKLALNSVGNATKIKPVILQLLFSTCSKLRHFKLHRLRLVDVRQSCSIQLVQVRVHYEKFHTIQPAYTDRDLYTLLYIGQL